MKKTWGFLLAGLLCALTQTADAGVKFYNSSGLDLGVVSEVKCSTGFTCSLSGGKLLMVTAPIDTSGALTLQNDDVLSNASDDILSFSSNDLDSDIRAIGFEAKTAIFSLWADQGDDATDKWSFVASDGSLLTIKNSTTALATVSGVGDWQFNGTTPYLTIGDTDQEDAGLVFAGNAVNYNMSLDDSADVLVLGVGTAAGTTDAVSIDASQNVYGPGVGSMYGFLHKETAATATTITASQCGQTFYNTGAVVINLPNGAASLIGCRLTFVTLNAANFDVNPGDSDQILVLTDAAGDAIRNATLGNSIVLQYVTTNKWAVIGKEQGTYSDVN